MGGKTFKVTNDNFQSDVLGNDKPVLIDFWAEWCAPCKQIAPYVDAISEEYEDQLAVGKLDADEYPELTTKYGVMSLPTLVLFKGGEPVTRIVGFKPTKQALIDKLEPHLD